MAPLAAAVPSLVLSDPKHLSFGFPSFFVSPLSPSTPSRHSSSIISSFTKPPYPRSPSFPALYPFFLPHSSHNTQFVLSNEDDDNDDDDDDADDEEQVIGDCLVFEDGIFEDPYLVEDLYPSTSPISPAAQKSISKKKPTTDSGIEPQNLVPEEWGQVVEEINLSKKERRKIAQELEFGQRIEKKKRLRNVNLEEYLRLRNEKLSQLKPLVLDNPTAFPSENEDDAKDGSEGGFNKGREDSNMRVEPRNPRWAVYGRGLDDITQFFNSGNYQPSDDNREGRQKLFTKEEKALLNARVPKLTVATSRKWLPLHTLAASGEFYLVNTLLKHKVDINGADLDGLTALHKAITCKKQAVTDYLLRESAFPFVCDKDGASLMHYAVRTASSQAIKTLLLHNVDMNLQDNDGWTPLHIAVQSRRTDVVRLLLMKGADNTIKNQDGLTPLGLCLYSGRDAKTCELIKLLKQLPRQHRRLSVKHTK